VRDVERNFARLKDMIDVATSRIAQGYFHLPVADADAVYRERVYCYELYLLRCVWATFPFSLGGEIDKAGHPHFENGPYAEAKPDLLVHIPGRMGVGDNLAVVEVKPATVRPDRIREDLQKLGWFCRNAGYFRGLFLVYGEAGEPAVLSNRIRQAAGPGLEFLRLECLYHRHVGEQAHRMQVEGL